MLESQLLHRQSDPVINRPLLPALSINLLIPRCFQLKGGQLGSCPHLIYSFDEHDMLDSFNESGPIDLLVVREWRESEIVFHVSLSARTRDGEKMRLTMFKGC